ncbi:MAG TPA: hypothetical protein VKU36_01725 [Candidatus Babeliales bacterium]|nr:hypothetical protein [Candidatus Babeliales bacterium]
MKNILFLIAIFNCISLLVGGENKNSIVIYAKINNPQLFYTGKKSINKCREFNIMIEDNSPCFTNCAYSNTKIFDPSKELLSIKIAKALNGNELPKDFEEVERKSQKIAVMHNILQDLNDFTSDRAIPLHCFVNEKDESRFKGVEDTLFSFERNIEGENVTFEVKLQSNLEKNPKDILDNFERNAFCTFGDEEELLARKIIQKSDHKMLQHGPNSYFESKKVAEAAKAQVLFYFQLKSCLKKIGTLSIGLLILYLVYQKVIKQV